MSLMVRVEQLFWSRVSSAGWIPGCASYNLQTLLRHNCGSAYGSPSLCTSHANICRLLVPLQIAHMWAMHMGASGPMGSSRRAAQDYFEGDIWFFPANSAHTVVALADGCYFLTGVPTHHMLACLITC